MKPEEAIMKVKQFGLYHAIEDLPHSTKTVEAFEMAIEALEKQTPKIPLSFGNEAYLCPCCKRNNFYCGTEELHKMNYCDYCGQAILWEEE